MKSFSENLFKYRSYAPIPFLVVMVIYAEPTLGTLLIGGTIVLLGEFIRYWGVAYAGPLTRVTGSVGAPELIVSGPFAHARNPLYVGNIILYLGIGVMSNALVPWLVVTAAIWFVFQYSVIVSLEESFLKQHFKDTYATYVRNVPRFIPRIRPFVSPAQTNQKPDWKGSLRSERRTLQAILLTIAIIVVRWSVG